MNKKTLTENIFKLSGLFTVFLSLFILLFLFYFSLPLFKPDNFFSLLSFKWQPEENFYGILPMMLASIYISILATLISFGLSFGIAGLLIRNDLPKIKKILEIIIKFMTSIPTVIYGFIAIFLLVPLIRKIFVQGSGFCLFTAAIVLSVLILPTMVLLMGDTFRQVPKKYREAAVSLGFNKFQEFLYVVVPLSSYGIFNAFILGLGRASGDTLIALMLAGNAPQNPAHFFDAVRTLTAHIALVLASDTQSVAFKSIFASGLILFLFMFVISAMSYFLIEKRKIRQ